MAKIENSLKNLYLSEVKRDIRNLADYPKSKITEEDILTLPKPVQRYFRHCGFIGKEKMINAKTEWKDIDFKRGQSKKWMRLDCLQYNSVVEPTRIAYMKNKIFGIFPFEARDKYQDGKGNMLIKLLKFFTVADAKGREMDKSALVTVLSEVCIVPSYALQDYIKWEAIDDNTANATLTHNDLTVGGSFNFSDQGEVKSFYTEDRYFAENDGTYKKIPWSIVIDNYTENDGMRFPGEIRVMWHLKDGDLEYFKGQISKVEYNVKE